MGETISTERVALRTADKATLRLMANGLVLLTAGLAAAGIEIAGGLLGGEFGYGGNFENDVFMMHQFCWCDRDDCAWCAQCSCSETAWSYFIDGVACTYEEFDKFFEDNVGPCPTDELAWPAWEAKAAAINERRGQVHTPTCHWCLHPEDVKPNFLHKASGTRATWYKYIGRGMEAQINGPWPSMLADCLASLAIPVSETETPAGLGGATLGDAQSAHRTL